MEGLRGRALAAEREGAGGGLEGDTLQRSCLDSGLCTGRAASPRPWRARGGQMELPLSPNPGPGPSSLPRPELDGAGREERTT